ncbi:MAG: nuclear transport factor 2 family protein [Chlamydiales bacterium]|nr:nuclear transport factor 2 family protein [Chlamydiales bacterium]
MSKKNLLVAESYYAAMNKKDIESMEKMLHPDILFIGPLAKLQGKEAVLQAIKGFTTAFVGLKIRGKFQGDNQVMLAIDTEFPEPIGNLRTASLLTIVDGLIIGIELFYDSRVVESKKEEVFSL